MSKTSLRWHISLARSLKLQAAIFSWDHSASSPQYRLAFSISPPELPFPQGHLITASSFTLVSGQKRVISKSSLPEWEGMTVVVEGQTA